MKKYFNIICLTILSAAILGCKKYLDVNENPNASMEVPLHLLLPSGQASTAIVIGGSFFNLGGFWSQYYTQSPDAAQYENIDSYNISTDFYDGEFQELYSGALRDYREIQDKAAEEGNNAYFLISTLMEAYTYQVLVDLYSSVPYSDALEGESGNITPTWDSGEEIYLDLLERIDAAIGRYNNDPTGVPEGDDLIYGGDMDHWIRFGNTLKLRMYMRMSFTTHANPTAVLDLINGGNLLTEDAAMTQFSSQIYNRNPFYEVQIDRLSAVNHVASRTLVSYLEANGDPRLSEIYAPAADGTYATKEQGDFANRDVRFADLAKPVITADHPVYLMTVMESEFLQAEALVRYSGGAGAEAHYESAMDAAFALHGITGVSNLYTAGGVYDYDPAATDQEKLELILTQKWAGMANIQNLEAFFEINRTGIPRHVTASDAGRQPGDLIFSLASVLPDFSPPRRLPYPNISQTRNPNTPSQPSNISEPVWWDQN